MNHITRITDWRREWDRYALHESATRLAIRDARRERLRATKPKEPSFWGGVFTTELVVLGVVLVGFAARGWWS